MVWRKRSNAERYKMNLFMNGLQFIHCFNVFERLVIFCLFFVFMLLKKNVPYRANWCILRLLVLKEFRLHLDFYVFILFYFISGYILGNNWSNLLLYCEVILSLYSWILLRWSSQVCTESWLLLLCCRTIPLAWLHSKLDWIIYVLADTQACWQLVSELYSFYWLAFLILELSRLGMFQNISWHIPMTISYIQRKNVLLVKSQSEFFDFFWNSCKFFLFIY
jgi:hypothetical protein